MTRDPIISHDNDERDLLGFFEASLIGFAIGMPLGLIATWCFGFFS